MKKLFLRTLLGIMLIIGVFAVNLVWFKPFFIREFYERTFLRFALDSPEILSSLRLLEPLGIQGHNKELNDASLAFEDEQLARLHQALATLHSYDTTGMEGQQRLSYKILDWFMTNQDQGAKFRYDNYPVKQFFGVQNDFPTFMATTHHVGDQHDAEDYNTRLSKLPAKFTQVLEGLKVREQHGVVPPTFVIDKVLAEMKNFTAQPPEQNILYTAFQTKLAKLPDLPAAKKTELLAATKKQLQTAVYPAYQGLITYLTALRPRSTADAGVWKFPDGAAYYAYCLRQNTTTNLSAKEIHALGLREVARITAEMRAILQAQHEAGADSVGPTMARLGEAPRFRYPDTDSGRAQILGDYRQILAEVDKGLAPAFRMRPKAELAVARVPEFKQKTSAGAYYDAAALDGSRPGTFYANLYDVKATPRFGMRTLAYHEGIPGHHFQIGLAQELQGLPTFRKVVPFTAYTEGWALYAEQLA